MASVTGGGAVPSDGPIKTAEPEVSTGAGVWVPPQNDGNTNPVGMGSQSSAAGDGGVEAAGESAMTRTTQEERGSSSNDNDPWNVSPAVTAESDVSTVSGTVETEQNKTNTLSDTAVFASRGTETANSTVDAMATTTTASNVTPQASSSSVPPVRAARPSLTVSTAASELAPPTCASPAMPNAMTGTPSHVAAGTPTSTAALSVNNSASTMGFTHSHNALTPTHANTSTSQQQQKQQRQSVHFSTTPPTTRHLHIDTAAVNRDHEAEHDGDNMEYQEGGRMWKAALKEVEKKDRHAKRREQQRRSRLAESIMERTRSRADPNALVAPTGGDGGKPSMVALGDNEGFFILSTALAKKRVRVVQLLLIGLVGLLLGLLGNFFVSTSCHFATVHISVGQNEQEFEFRFGLWKYSPIESVFQGYPYCYKYDQNFSAEAPVIARTANIVALVFGLVSISTLWLYLIFGFTDKRRWKWAVRIAVIAGLVQLGTLYFFFGTICQEYACFFGPGAYLAVFTSVVWFVLACEMHYHMPVAMYAFSAGGPTISALEEPRSLVTTMEMSRIADEVTHEYITRVTGKSKEDEMPTLNTDLRRVRPRSGLYTPTSPNGCGLYFPSSPRGTYQAPDPSMLEEASHDGGRPPISPRPTPTARAANSNAGNDNDGCSKDGDDKGSK